MATTSETPLTIDSDTFATYSDTLQAAAFTTTRLAATSLPADLSFHRSIDPALVRDIDVFSERVLGLVSKLIRVAGGNSSRIRDEEDVVDEFVRNIVDPMDGMLESTDGALDVFLGRKRDPVIPIPAVPVNPHQSKPKARKQSFRGRLDPALTHASHIPKPQLSFTAALANTNESPYIPATLIPHKWCAKVPLGYVFHDEASNQDIEDIRQSDVEEDERKRTLHPYYYELTRPTYPDHVFDPPAEPSPPTSLDIPSSDATTTPLTFISTPKALLSMTKTISSVSELAVDLEHHSYRSYKGFLALMQISTRHGDFVVDLLVPEIREGFRQATDKNVGASEDARMANEAGQIIAKMFADPSVIKVFHGADSDIVWLQQDFNIFVVGLFDTFHASKVLEFPKHGLAYLLEIYCDFIPDKRYQLADWRIRPLPTEMLTYARSDTHFLLYIYDMLRLSLTERSSTAPAAADETRMLTRKEQAQRGCGLIQSILTRSSRTALRLYENEVYDAEGGTGSGGWETLAKKWNKIGLIGSPLEVRGTGAQRSQSAVYKAVHQWREDTAREEDESTRYVLSTHHLFLLVERVPTTVADLLSLFGGPGTVRRIGMVPPVLKRRAGELVAVIKGAMEATELMSSLRGSADDKSEDIKLQAPTVIEELVTTSSAMPSSSVVKATDESRLWTVVRSTASPAIISISQSSLFGMGIAGGPAQERGVELPSLVSGEATCSATESVLFGSPLSKTITASTTIKTTLIHAGASDRSAERFRDLMEKIHKTLVIAPVVSIPKFLPSVQTQASETSPSGVPEGNSTVHEASAPIPPGFEGQIEMPFVPSHKRHTLSNPQNYEPKDDTIVVVGQAGTRQRKRKRDKAKNNALTSQLKSGTRGVESSTSAGDHDREMEEFDYSSVPNLLDNEGVRESGGVHEEDERRKKKQRHAKGSGIFEYGNFRAPPRDQREVKSGNKTHTFR
ncbi:ribonuclease H-like domain-containing protein [Chiua virens]|nr:ribonuclease H-like domain-containing protein [Chiua virens]